MSKFTKSQPLEVADLVCVTVDHVEYYGYIEDVDYEVLLCRVEFFPGCTRNFDISEVERIEYPVKAR